MGLAGAPDPPAHWGWGQTAYLLVGALAHSGPWRGRAGAESETMPHFIDGLDADRPRARRADPRLAVRPDGHGCHPETGRVTASFAAVAKHYGVSVEICPPRRGNRKGVVEKANHTAAQRWWRTCPTTPPSKRPRRSLDRFAHPRRRPATPGRHRRREAKATVATVADGEPLAPVPGAVPGEADRPPAGLRAGAGRLPRQLLLGATRAGPRPGHRLATARRPATSTSPQRHGAGS